MPDDTKEIERLRALNSRLTDKANACVIENARLAEDAARWRYAVTHCAWVRRDDGDVRCSYLQVQLPYDADQSCVATRNAAIDSVMEEERKKWS